MVYNNQVSGSSSLDKQTICEDGGIGRRARLRGELLTAVRVQVSFLAPQKKGVHFGLLFFCVCVEKLVRNKTGKINKEPKFLNVRTILKNSRVQPKRKSFGVVSFLAP